MISSADRRTEQNERRYSFMEEKWGKAIVLDTETTGLSPYRGDELLQVSIVDIYGDVIFNHYIRPTMKKSWPGAQKVNDITPAMVRDEQSILYYKGELDQILSDASCYIGYNTDFDIRFLKAAGIRCTAGRIDVMEEYARYCGYYNARYGRFRRFRLEECADYFGYDWGTDQQHDSLADARATLYCFRKLLETEETGVY